MQKLEINYFRIKNIWFTNASSSLAHVQIWREGSGKKSDKSQVAIGFLKLWYVPTSRGN